MQKRDNGVLSIYSKPAKTLILPEKPLSKKKREELEKIRFHNDEQKEIFEDGSILTLDTPDDTMNGNNDNDVSSMYDNKTTTVVNVDEKHSADTTVEQKQPISSASSNSSFGLQLTEEGIREAESWKIDNKEGWKARLRDDHDFGPILTFLKGGTMGESVEKVKNLRQLIFFA